MYLQHFGLTTNPFGLSPKLDFLYRSEAFEESIAHLLYGLDNSEAIIMITGPIGAGKTMAIQSFLAHLGPDFSFALITNTRVTSVELLKLIIEDLEVKTPERPDKSDLLIAFKDHLIESSRHGKRVLIVIDEAQNLELEVLEEVRMLTNLGQGDGQPVQVILLGQPELEARVNQRELAQLRQRIRVHYRLDSLSREETELYLNHRMAVAGCKQSVFEKKAIDRIFELSAGIPRLVNSLAGAGLLATYVAGRKKVKAEDVSDTDLDAVIAIKPDPSRAKPAKREPDPIPEAKARVESPLPPPPPPPVPEPESVPVPEPAVAAPPVGPVRRPAERSERKSPLGFWVAAAVLLAILGWLYVSGYMGLPVPSSVRRWLPPTGTEAENAMAGPAESTPRRQVTHDPAPVAEIAMDSPAEANTVAEPETQGTNTNTGETDDSPPVEEPRENQGAVVALAPSNTSNDSSAPPPDRPTSTSQNLMINKTFVHISSFRTSGPARATVSRFESRSQSALFKSVKLDGEYWYRVYLGPFSSRNDAQIAAERLRQEGQIEYFMVTTLAVDAGS